jgi:hypothetical protein
MPMSAWWGLIGIAVIVIVATLGLGGIGALLIGWLVWWLWWRLPKREVAKMRHGIRSAKDRVEVEDTLRKTISQALGAIAVLIGAGFGFWQFFEQRDTAQQQIAVSQQQMQASHDLLVSNQVAKGFEQLGSDKLTIRLGGIYALEGVMNTSPEYHQPVLEALCAFVREGTIGVVINGAPATDIQATLTVVGRRSNGPGRVNLAEARIAKADLTDADLTDANLTDANLTGADLTRANLSYADLTGASGLSQAQLDAACGTGVRGLRAGLTLDKPCPSVFVPAQPPNR